MSARTPRSRARRVAGTYMFCVFAASRAPRLAGAPAGPDGLGPLRALHLGGTLWAAVADAPPDRFSDAAIRRTLRSLDAVAGTALAHEAVVRHLFKRRAVLPFKLFTIYASDDRARADLGARAARLTRLLARLERHEEWGVTIAPGAPRPVRTEARRSGVAYLQARRQALAGSRSRSLGDAAELLVKALARGTADRRIAAREPDEGGPAIATAFLLDRARRAAWRTRLRRVRGRLQADGWTVAVSGPWPPYSFMPGMDEP